MLFILNAFILSIRVALHMILPLIGITIASTVIWFVLGILTLGMSGLISVFTTSAFITLFGIRKALELKGDRSHLDLKVMATYSVAFGAVLTILAAIIGSLAVGLSLFVAASQLDETITLQNTDDSARAVFAMNVLSIFAVLSLLGASALNAMFAVPLAAAARTAGSGAKSTKFLQGFGSSFIWLFPIFIFSYFFQFFFDLFHLIFFAFGTLAFQLHQLISQIAAAIGSEGQTGLLEMLDTVSPVAIAYSLLSVFALIWLQSLIWSASALALIKHEGKTEERSKVAKQDAAPISTDLRSLRKARENRNE